MLASLTRGLLALLMSIVLLAGSCSAASGEHAGEACAATEGPHGFKAVGDEYVCAGCGFVCPHAATEEIVDAYSWLESDEKAHMVIQHVNTAFVCLECGGAVNVICEDKPGTPQPHTFENDGLYCDECGYPRADGCEHVAPDAEDPGSWGVADEYVFIDERSHMHHVERTYTPLCEVCGAWIPGAEERTETESEEQPHEYGESGRCACGWRADGGFAPSGAECKHARTRTETRHSPGTETRCQPYDAQRHLNAGACVDVELWCEDCGLLVDCHSYFDPEYTWMSEHCFESYDGQTVCPDCGCTTGCAHEDWLLTNHCLEPVSEPVDTGNGTHVALVNGGAWYACAGCGAQRYEEHEYEMLESPHKDRDHDGLCDGCGAETGASAQESHANAA